MPPVSRIQRAPQHGQEKRRSSAVPSRLVSHSQIVTSAVTAAHNSSAWGSPALVALLAAGASIVGLLVGKFLDRGADKRRWQREREASHDQFLRDQRISIYGQFLTLADRIYNLDHAQLRGGMPNAKFVLFDDMNRLMGLRHGIDLLANEATAIAASKVTGLLVQMDDMKTPTIVELAGWFNATTEIQSLFRQELGLPPRYPGPPASEEFKQEQIQKMREVGLLPDGD